MVIAESTTTAATNAPKTTSKAASVPTSGCATSTRALLTAPRLKDAGARASQPAATLRPVTVTTSASISTAAATGDLTAVLRGDAARRRTVDPGLAGGLREWLEDGVAGPAAELGPDAVPVVIGASAVAGVVGTAGTAGVRDPSIPLVRAAMVTALFRQLVTTGHFGDPFHDALDTLAADDRDAELAAFASRLRPDEREVLADQVRAEAMTMSTRWPRIPPAWLPRTGDRMTVPLAGGRVVLAGVADLVLGAPPVDRSSVCLVEVRTSAPAEEHRRARTFLGLLETLRSGAAPIRVATYYSGPGVLDAEEPGDEELGAAVREVIATAAERCRALVGAAA
jgi:hypothetical protein